MNRTLEQMPFAEDRESKFKLDEVISLLSRTPKDGKLGSEYYNNTSELELLLCLANEIRRLNKEIMKNKKHKIKIEIPEGYVIKKTIIKDIIDEWHGLCKLMNADIILEPIKKPLPKTWEEYLRQSNKCYPTVNHIRIPLEYNEVFKALAQLIELRDRYNDGWEPDWKNEDQTKYGISILNGHAIVDRYNLFSVVLSFKSTELRNEFLKNFRALIETAKPLL